jgi:hypothetical protein
MKDKYWHIRYYYPEKSAVAQHSINLGGLIHFQDTGIIKKAAKIQLHTDNFPPGKVIEALN